MKRVYELGRELYKRLPAMGGHLDRLGRALDRSVKACNETAGSLEGRVMVTAREFHTLRLVEGQLCELRAVEQTTRHLGGPELTGSAAADASVRALPAPARDDVSDADTAVRPGGATAEVFPDGAVVHRTADKELGGGLRRGACHPG